MWLRLVTLLLVLAVPTVRPKVRMTEAFMSSADLKDIFRMEQAMVNILKTHKEQLEASLSSIRSYVSDVEELYQGENCWPPDTCSDDVLSKRIVGNPIYNYQMLKRLMVYWKNMEDTIKKVDTKQALSDLKKAKHKHGGMPTDRDLQGAAKALIRLRSTYRLNLTDFSHGKILGIETEAHLSTKDSFFLGRFAYMSGHLDEAQRWLELTALQVASEARTSNNTSVNPAQLDQMLNHVQQKLSSGGAATPPREEDDVNPSAKQVYKLGVIPPKTHDRSKMVTDNDRFNYAALCRGLDLLPPSMSKDLKCSLVTRGNPYYILHPIKMEVHHPYPHKIVSFHEFLSPREADDLVAIAQPRMVKASVGHGKEVSEMRVSRNCWIKDFENGLVDKVAARINWITGLQTTKRLDAHKEGKEEEYEHLQIANYGIGGHYDAHQDPMFVYKEPDFMAYSVENKDNNEPYITGDRLATFMLYLSEVPLGGRTAFPRLGVAVRPEKGSAVFWFNLKRSGRSDMAMLHGGCPVVLGSKWVANKWIREAAQIFHNKCVGHINY